MNSVTFTGGLRIGESYWSSLNYSWPLAELELKDETLTISALLARTIVLSRDDILGVSEYRGVISDGVQILHSSKNHQPFVVFWTSPAKVAAEFHKFGLTIKPLADDDQAKRLRARFSLSRFVIFFALLFGLLLTNELHRPQPTIDAILNATVLTGFAAIAALMSMCAIEPVRTM